MKKQLIFLFLSLLGTSAFGQQYTTAVGVKGHWSTLYTDMAQISVKHFFQPPNAVEVNLSGGRQFIWIEGLYLYNQPMKSNFDWYVGGGVDLGYWGPNSGRQYDTKRTQGFWGGVTTAFGVEHTFDFIPLNVFVDAGPTVRVIPSFEVGLKVGFGVRYAFGTRN